MKFLAVTVNHLSGQALATRYAKLFAGLAPKKQRICFFGHFGLGNFGNESTLQAMLHHVRRLLPEAELTCICTGPSATARIHDIRALPISRVTCGTWKPTNRFVRDLRSLLIGLPSEVFRWLEGFRTLKSTDVLVVPGTGLVTDAYSLRGWGPYSLFKWSAIAKIRGCKLFFVSVGAGPIYSRLGRFFVKSSLALADFRSYRDVSSLDYLKSIGFAHSEDKVCPDLAFSLPQAIFPPHRQRRGQRAIIGIGVMLYAGKYSTEHPTEKTNRNYLDALAILVSSLLERDYDIRLLIGDMCDRPVVNEFKGMLNARLTHCDPRRILDEEVTSVEHLLLQLSETDLVVATRFHNVLLALLSNKPVVAISFHHKVSSLMSSMGLSEYCLEIDSLNVDDLMRTISEAERNRDALISMIKERTNSHRLALEEQYHSIYTELK
jgi:polysaccharide pyruvyl transferase WcaK-like protein